MPSVTPPTRARWRGGRWPGRAGLLDRIAGRDAGRADADRGAVAVTVALLLGSGVLVGFMAIVIDVGQIYVERTQLQTSADAAALGIARACANHTSGCDNFGAVRGVADHYANGNSGDGVTNVAEICGRHEGMLAACGPAATNHTACLGQVPASGSYVEVRVSTEVPGSRFVLPPTFAQAMAGNSGYDGASVGACARATWGSDELTILAMTISVCEFDEATDNGTHFVDPPDPVYPPWPSTRDEHVIEFWFDSYERLHGPCDSNPGLGWDRPGDAGFLVDANGTCRIRIDDDGLVRREFFNFDIYVRAPVSCEQRVRTARADFETIYLPVHDGTRELGSESEHRHVFVAPFVVTGFQFGAPPSVDPPYNAEDHRLPSRLSGHPCDEAGHRCLSGFFVGEPVPLSSLTGETYVRLIG
jgi:Flp pilus assembly protein TadG